MWVIAHRGGGDLFPENTLEAFRAAESLGVDMVEADVQLSRDGELVVIHDPTLLRTGGQPAPVEALTAEELAQVDVGHGYGVPRLTDVLDAIRVPVVVELKTPKAGQALLELFSAHPHYVARVIPISFDHRVVRLLKERLPTLEAGILLVGVPVDLPAVARAAGVRLVSLHYAWVDPPLVEALHREDIMISVWTPNTPEAIAPLVHMAVDAIASDRPDLVLRAIGRHL
ncbi:MAG: glycerophosphodiester phosphodiesterase [Firmicutes bacterium]|nr:glycerophosphodiester phosphodiesterase [Bacillota bacterium]